MASSGLELLWVSLPQLGKGAAQTLSISFLSIAISTVGGVLYGVLAQTLGAEAPIAPAVKKGNLELRDWVNT